MGFDLLPIGTELRFVSQWDNAIDWKQTEEEESGFSREDYADNAKERASRVDRLRFRDGKKPTVFLLEIPRGSVLANILRGQDPTAITQDVAYRHIKAAEDLYDGDGKPVQITRKGDRTLERRCIDAIPAFVISEIGDYLINRGNGLDLPL